MLKMHENRKLTLNDAKYMKMKAQLIGRGAFGKFLADCSELNLWKRIEETN